MIADNDESTHALNFHTFEDCMTEQPKDWLFKNVMAFREDSTWFGPPGSLKSALLTDIAVHFACGRDWCGHEFNRKADNCRGVVYFAMERAGLTRRRLRAHATRDGLPANVPIAVVDEAINLLDPMCVRIVGDTIFSFEENAECHVGLVIFDTFAKGIAAGGGDEDKALAQNIAATNLKKIREFCGGLFHIATIGHTGKNPTAGERGSNAKLGHVDLAVQISGDKVRTATIVKANDQPEGPLASFAMDEVAIQQAGREPFSVAILAAATPVKEARPAASRPLSGKHAQALDALTRAIAERGQDGAVHSDFWKEELTKGGLIKLNDTNPRTTFSRIRSSVAQHIIEADGFVRLNQPGNIPPCPA